MFRIGGSLRSNHAAVKVLNESDCLTSQMLNSNVFDEMDDHREHVNEIANIESSSSLSKSSVLKECFDLLTEFEVPILI